MPRFFSQKHHKISLALTISGSHKNHRNSYTSSLAFIHEKSRASIKRIRAIHKSSSFVLVLLIRRRLVLKLSLHFKLVYWSRSLFHWFKSEHRYAFPTDWSVLTFYGRKRLSGGAQECEVSGWTERNCYNWYFLPQKTPNFSHSSLISTKDLLVDVNRSAEFSRQA